MNSNRIEIGVSNKKTLKLLIYAVILNGLGILIIVLADEQQTIAPNNAKILGYATLCFLIPALIFVIRRLFDHSPKVIIDTSGITDKSSVTSPGFIPWRNIDRFLIKTVYKTKLLAIVLKKPVNSFTSQNSIQAMFNHINNSIFEPSYMISTNYLDIEFEEFATLVKKFHRKYGNHNNPD